MHHHPDPIESPAPPGTTTSALEPQAAGNRDALSPREVAQRTGLSYHAVLREIHRGALQAKQVCDGSRILIPIDAYRAWLAPSEMPADGAPAVASSRRRRSSSRALPTQSGSFERLLALEEESAA